MMRFRFQLLVISIFLTSLCAEGADAYKISALGQYHERMTVLAQRCISAPTFPSKCAIPANVAAFKKVPAREGKYWLASRWSDDPTLQSASLGGAKFLWNVGFDKCMNYIGEFNDFPGVLCSGHYGTLQFLHSMASLQDGETVGNAQSEPMALTRGKMLGWTEFAFKIATGAQPIGDPYCETVRAYGAAGVALAPARFPFCGEWSAGTVFGFSCSDPWSSASCKVNGSEPMIQRSATGALLHMIQDSYSRSHTGRGEHLPNGPYPSLSGTRSAAEVRCEPVTAFYRYSLEQKKSHGAADQAPRFAARCSRVDTMDPITASARVIWLVENRCNAGWARALIAEGVLDNRNSPFPENVKACRLAPSARAS